MGHEVMSVVVKPMLADSSYGSAWWLARKETDQRLFSLGHLILLPVTSILHTSGLSRPAQRKRDWSLEDVRTAKAAKAHFAS